MNLLDYEISDNRVHINQQWKPLRGIGSITQIGPIDVRSLAYPKFSESKTVPGHGRLEILGSNTIDDIVPIIIPKDRLNPVQQALETLSKIPVHTCETHYGTVEYILLECPATVVMLGSLPQDILERLHWHIYHNRFWAQPRRSILKFSITALETAITFLNKRPIETIFYKEPGVEL